MTILRQGWRTRRRRPSSAVGGYHHGTASVEHVPGLDQRIEIAPQSTILCAVLLNYLVGLSDQSGWYLQSKRFRRLQVQRKNEFSRLSYRKVSHLCALENFVDHVSPLIWHD